MQCSTSLFVLTTLGALTLAASRPVAAQSYLITDVGALPGQPNSSAWQQTINNSGVIAAYANSSPADIANSTFFGDAPFLWQKGTITPLSGLPNAIDTIPFSLNNVGQVVGRSTPDGQRNHAVVWDNGVIHALGELPGDNSSAALKINDQGQAVGYSRKPVAEGNDRHATLWDKGTVTQLTPLPGAGTYDEALGINEAGQIVGWSGPSSGLEHIALWNGSSVHDLGTLGGAWGEAIAINDRGQIVGLSATASGPADPFLWENGALTDLGVLAGDVGGVALSANDKGQIVGISGTSLVNGQLTDIYTSHAVMWENGQMIDLQTLIPAGSGWTLTGGLGINDAGQIVAQGVYDGTLRTVLLTSVPEPGTTALLLAGSLTGAGLLLRRHRR